MVERRPPPEPVVKAAPPARRLDGEGAGPAYHRGHGTSRSPRRAARLLRRGRDGDQGAHLDGAGLRATGVLLSRDRPQRRRRRCLRASRRRIRRRHRNSAGGCSDHALRARLRPRGCRGGDEAGRGHDRCGVPARDKGPSRGEADGGERTRDHLRGPRRSRRGGRHRRRGPGGSDPRRPRGGSRPLLPCGRHPGGAARPDDARALRVGRGARGRPRSLPGAVDGAAQRSLLRHDEPAGRSAAPRRTSVAHPRRRIPQQLQHPGAGAGRSQRRG